MPPTPSPDPVLIKMVGSEPSFWDSTLWTGALPIIGVLLGALAAYLLAQRQEKQKAERALATHFIDQVVEYSTRLTRKTEDFVRSGHDLVILLEHEEHVRQRKSEQAQVAGLREFLDRTVDEIVEDHSRLSLIAPSALRDGSQGIGIVAAGVVIQDDLDAAFLRSSLTRIEKMLSQYKADVRRFVGVVEMKELASSRSPVV